MRLQNLTVSLLLSTALLGGCNSATVSPSSTPTGSSATQASATPAAETPVASAEPVQVGDKMVFTDPKFGYSFAFNPEYWFNGNSQAMDSIKDGAGDIVDKDLLATTSYLFTLQLTQPSSTSLIPTLIATAETVPVTAGSLDNKKYAALGRTQVERHLKGVYKKDPYPVTINGTEYYLSQFTMDVEGKKVNMDSYSIYDAKKRVALSFGYTTFAPNEAKDRAAFEEVIQTLKFPK